MSLFDSLRRDINGILGEWEQGIGGGGLGRRGSLRGRGDPFASFGMGFDPMSDLLDIGMSDVPMITSGQKGGEEQKSVGVSGPTTEEQRLVQQGGQLPVLRCRVNVEDKPNEYVVTAEMPGFDRQNLNVSVNDDNVLTVSGEQKKEHIEEAKNKHFLRVERSFGSVQRSLRLPKNIKKEQVSAQYQNGILHINIPKVKEEETKQQKVQIK